MHLCRLPQRERARRVSVGGEGSGRGDARVSILLRHPVHFLPRARVPMVSRA